MRSYEETLDWIMSFWDPGRPKEQERALRPLKIQRMRTLLEKLGSPQLRYPSILIAGTKGKGSTCAFMSEGLRAGGYRVGRYTQPHLLDWRERTWVNGTLISPAEVAEIATRIRPAVEEVHSLGGERGLTTYEVGTALTLVYFADRMVDIAVLEIGIGGRLDALNAVDPVLSVITSISLDHTDVLGDTLAEIAAEKAGIMRRGVRVISSPQRPEAEAALVKAAVGTGAHLSLVGRNWRWEPGAEAGTINVYGPQGDIESLDVPLLGDHQKDNATVAVAALQLLGDIGFPVGEDEIRRGISGTEWPGRIQRLRESPLIVADAAHNVDSAERLAETVRQEFKYDRLILVFGASGEKDVAGMAQVLGQIASEVIVTSSGHRRAADAARLAQEFQRYAPVQVEPDPEAAFQTAIDMAAPGDLVLVTGSVFLAGRAIQVMSDR